MEGIWNRLLGSGEEGKGSKKDIVSPTKAALEERRRQRRPGPVPRKVALKVPSKETRTGQSSTTETGTGQLGICMSEAMGVVKAASQEASVAQVPLDDPELINVTYCGLEVRFFDSPMRIELLKLLLVRLENIKLHTKQQQTHIKRCFARISDARLSTLVHEAAQRRALRQTGFALPVIVCSRVLFADQACCRNSFAIENDLADLRCSSHFVLGILSVGGCSAETYAQLPVHIQQSLLLQLCATDSEFFAYASKHETPRHPLNTRYDIWQRWVADIDRKDLFYDIQTHAYMRNASLPTPFYVYLNHRRLLVLGRESGDVQKLVLEDSKAQKRNLTELAHAELVALHMQLYCCSFGARDPSLSAESEALPARLCVIESSRIRPFKDYGRETEAEREFTITHWPCRVVPVVKTTETQLVEAVRLETPLLVRSDTSGLACMHRGRPSMTEEDLKQLAAQPRLFSKNIIWTLRPSQALQTGKPCASSLPTHHLRPDAPRTPCASVDPVLRLPSHPALDSPETSVAYCHHTVWLELDSDPSSSSSFVRVC